MFILTLGVFGILNTEMGVVGIIPIIAETFGVTVPDAGWTVSLFAADHCLLCSRRTVTFSRVNRKTVMVLALFRVRDFQPRFGLHRRTLPYC